MIIFPLHCSDKSTDFLITEMECTYQRLCRFEDRLDLLYFHLVKSTFWIVSAFLRCIIIHLHEFINICKEFDWSKSYEARKRHFSDWYYTESFSFTSSWTLRVQHSFDIFWRIRLLHMLWSYQSLRDPNLVVIAYLSQLWDIIPTQFERSFVELDDELEWRSYAYKLRTYLCLTITLWLIVYDALTSCRLSWKKKTKTSKNDWETTRVASSGINCDLGWADRTMSPFCHTIFFPPRIDRMSSMSSWDRVFVCT